MKSLRRLPASLVLVALVSACTLPRGAAMQREILKNADAETPSFAHYQIDSALLKTIGGWPAGRSASVKRQWLKGGRGTVGQVLAPGDKVAIAVWENGTNKLLSVNGAPSAQLQQMTISAKGTVFMPYVGPVKVSGLAPDVARAKIEEQVSQFIPDAQIQLEAQPGQSNSVSIVGGVARPGAVPLVDRSTTVLGLISDAGGALPSIENPQLRLQRGGQVYQISMRRVLDDPSLDAGVRPGDKLIVEKDPRTFLALGASGREQVVPFPKDQVNALEAVTLVGGLNAMRADPKGVLILRQYAPAAVHADGLGGPTNQRVVFTIDLTTTDGLFSAQNFQVEPDDLVLATESPVNNVRTIVGLFSSVAAATNNAVKVENNLK
ncbi:MAG: polysaccharide biosynthesis/export family protein [Paenirhodobacter sp.]|uniref:polysaccharide biosynthesis/export family protein n=1 Tax=Paenirhodobacter sp. TaxID=1965326 RepID=UPI003D12EC6D